MLRLLQSLHHRQRTYENTPHKSVAFVISSTVITGGVDPEKNANCSSWPFTYVAIHCVSALAHSVLLCKNFLSPGMLNRYRFPLPAAFTSAPNAPLSSAGVSVRICAIQYVAKLIEIFSLDNPTSPVTDFAVELLARQYPCSCATPATVQLSPNPTTTLQRIFRIILQA
jgi:hypothetical protein